MTVQNDPLKHPDQRVGVFIDVQNLYYSARNLFQCKVDFGNVVEDSVDGRKLIRSIAYVVRTDSEDEEAFFEALYNLGIETREKDLQVYNSGNKKADWDVGLTVDAIRLSPSLDSIIICSGDGDYVQLVEYLQKSSGKQVEIASFGKSTSTALVEQADNFLDLCDDPDQYLIGYEGD